MIWTILGISVGIVAIFCVASSEVLLGHPLFDQHRYEVAAALVLAGMLAWFVGRHFNRKQCLMIEEGEDRKLAKKFILFDLRYWGPMLLTLGVVALFVRPVRPLPVEPVRVPVTPPPKVPAAVIPEAPKPQPKAPVIFPDLRLQGVIFREDRPSVIINGHLLAVGDHINEVEIKSIGRSHVVLEFSGEVRAFNLP